MSMSSDSLTLVLELYVIISYVVLKYLIFLKMDQRSAIKLQGLTQLQKKNRLQRCKVLVKRFAGKKIDNLFDNNFQMRIFSAWKRN